MRQPACRPNANRPTSLYTVRSDTGVIRRGQRVAIIGADYTDRGLVYRVVGEADLHDPDRVDYWSVFEIRASNLVPVDPRSR